MVGPAYYPLHTQEEAVDLFSYVQVGLERLTAWLLADVLTAPNLAQLPADDAGRMRRWARRVA